MSRVLVVTSSPLFAEGGHLVIARALVAALEGAGHEAGILVTPQNRFGRQGAAYLAAWLTDVGLGADDRQVSQVISFRYPSYAVRHPRHVCWLNHRMREYYDLWPRFVAGLASASRMKERVRRWLVHRADRYLLTKNVRKVYAQSRTVQARLQRFGRIPSEVLYPPAPPRAYRCDEYGDAVLAVSRLAPLKRLDLVIRAVALPESGRPRLVIAGDGSERTALESLAAGLGIADRVAFVGALGDDALVDRLARCRAVCFPPYDEDFGLVTVEAFASAKPVVTCSDSGGAAELVRDGAHGFVCDPTPQALAVALGRLTSNRDLAARLGAAGRMVAADLTWEKTVARLLLA